jgi:hypothetical protein
MTVTYEWVIEETDPTHEVIIDVNHAPTYGEALAFAKQLKHCDLALVRDHETIHGVDRSWAYVENNRLPSHLRDASDRQVVKVPNRYRKQFDQGDLFEG